MSFDIQQFMSKKQDLEAFKKAHWTGSFQDYVNLVNDNPKITRNAYQRLYDMIVSWGTEESIDTKKKINHYKFFEDPIDNGADAVFGLDVPLMKLVNILHSAAKGYGPQNRVILLHGPVGSSKSTIARMLKKGLELYSKTDAGALYSFSWINPDKEDIPVFRQLSELGLDEFPDPMNEEPLKLIPEAMRAGFIDEFCRGKTDSRIRIQGDLNPASRFFFTELMKHYKGDWTRVIRHVKVRRLIFSEKDRIGLGTFQPKHEKNQDLSTTDRRPFIRL